MEKIHELEKNIGELYYAILYAGNIESQDLLKKMQDRMILELEELKNSL